MAASASTNNRAARCGAAARKGKKGKAGRDMSSDGTGARSIPAWHPYPSSFDNTPVHWRRPRCISALHYSHSSYPCRRTDHPKISDTSGEQFVRRATALSCPGCTDSAVRVSGSQARPRRQRPAPCGGSGSGPSATTRHTGTWVKPGWTVPPPAHITIQPASSNCFVPPLFCDPRCAMVEQRRPEQVATDAHKLCGLGEQLVEFAIAPASP